MTVERAVRAGLLESIDDAEQRGSLNALVAVALRQVVEHAPVQRLIDGGQDIAGSSARVRWRGYAKEGLVAVIDPTSR